MSKVCVGEVHCPRCGFVFTGVKANRNIFCNCGWKRIAHKVVESEPDVAQEFLPE